MTTRLLLLAVLGLVLQCFSAWKAFPSSTMHRRSSQLNMKHTEGNGLAAFARSLSWKPFASIAMSSMLLTSPLQIDLQHSQIHTNYAQAAVGEGDLPPGPIAFSRLQRFQVSLTS